MFRLLPPCADTIASRAFALLMLIGIAFAASRTDAEPIVTNEQVFYVPFNVPAGVPESLPKLIELFVSGDRGETWQSYQKRSPKEGRFTFHAGGDGVYFFATRSVNQNGQASPAQVKEPELIVVVDRTQPALQANAVAQPNGQVIVQWDSSDTNLAPDLVTVKYRGVGDNEDSPWQPTDVRGNSRLLPNGKLSGKIAIWPPAGSQMIQIQVTTHDRAGNTTVFDRELRLTDEAPSLANLPPTLPLLAAGSPPTAAVGPVPPNSSSPSEAWPSENAQHAPAPHHSLSLDWSNPARQMRPQPPVASAYPPTGNQRSPQSNETSFAQTEVLDEPSIDGPSQANLSQDSFGPTSQYRLSKSRRFHLDYDIESGDDIDVYRVEVWATDDGGRTWQHLGDDEDRVSPYLVDTRGDGMYGFRLIVQSKEGLTARPPQNGDPADVWVRVDATAPTTRLTSARFGKGAELGTLQITWDVRDDDLSDQPISLHYSSEPNGPWRNIARDLPNTGRYDWRVDDRTPLRLFLRLEATDRAGNIGTDALRDPIKTDSLSPKGFIRGIRPAAHTN